MIWIVIVVRRHARYEIKRGKQKGCIARPGKPLVSYDTPGELLPAFFRNQKVCQFLQEPDRSLCVQRLSAAECAVNDRAQP